MSNTSAALKNSVLENTDDNIVVNFTKGVVSKGGDIKLVEKDSGDVVEVLKYDSEGIAGGIYSVNTYVQDYPHNNIALSNEDIFPYLADYAGTDYVHKDQTDQSRLKWSQDLRELFKWNIAIDKSFYTLYENLGWKTDEDYSYHSTTPDYNPDTQVDISGNFDFVLSPFGGTKQLTINPEKDLEEGKEYVLDFDNAGLVYAEDLTHDEQFDDLSFKVASKKTVDVDKKSPNASISLPSAGATDEALVPSVSDPGVPDVRDLATVVDLVVPDIDDQDVVVPVKGNKVNVNTFISSLKDFKPKDFRRIKPSQIKTIPSESFEGFTGKQIKNLSPEAIAAFTPKQIKSLSTNAISGLTKEQASRLKTTVLNNLTAQQIKSLSTNAISGLTKEQASGLKARIMKNFTARQIPNLSKDTFMALSPAQLKKLGKDAVTGLSCKQLKTLDGEELSAFKPAQIKAIPGDVISCLKPLALNALKKEQVNAFTSIQLGRLSEKQIEKANIFKSLLTASQKMKLSDFDDHYDSSFFDDFDDFKPPSWL